MVCIKVQSSYIAHPHEHKITTANPDTVHQRHAQTIHLRAVLGYTTVACCYHVSRGETGDSWSSKKQRQGHLWLNGISLFAITLETNTIPLATPLVGT